MALKTKFLLAIKLLTPLHIGTGNELVQDFDYVVFQGGKTLRLHEERILEWISERGEDFSRLTQGVPPSEILGPALSPDSPFVRYALPGPPQGTREIRECIKDVYDRPYLPASSFKGALRTVLLWKIWKNRRLALSKIDLKKKKEYAAKSLEEEVFGKTPHEDVLRALRLRDAYPVERDRLVLVNVRVVSRSSRNGIPVALEAIASQTAFLMEGHIDETAFKPWGNWSREKFLPKEKRGWLSWAFIAQAARERALQKLEHDIRWAERVGIKPEPWEKLSEEIHAAERSSRKGFPLQIGFGSGWLSTTLGPALLADPDYARLVHERYGLGRNPRSGRKTPPDRYPASRRLARLGNFDLPLGWVWVLPKEEG